MGILSLYKPGYSKTLVYMLQSTEYQPGAYLKWYWRTSDFSRVAKRRELHMTFVARVLLLFIRLGLLLQILAGLALIGLHYYNQLAGAWQFGLALIIAAPIIWAHLLVLPIELGRIFIIKPREFIRVRRSRKIFGKQEGVKIAVAGSYGKTTMKEILATVLKAGKKVAATPANKNVASSHAAFARKLKYGTDVLIIEYGEGKPGDVKRFIRTTTPDIGIVTGLAPAHLDKYKTIQRAAKDIMSLVDFVGTKHAYVSGESDILKPYLTKKQQRYSQKGVAGWKVKDVDISIDGTSFTLSHGSRNLKLHSGLLGRHQIGPLALAANLAADLGMTDKQIVEGVSNTLPFEHRMQPRMMSGGWIIDDTYNGNIEGVRVGLELLKELEATRKWYVTPGLVDQGRGADKVHEHMGSLIAKAKPDVVVLMNNSATDSIKAGLDKGKFKGELRIEDDPLDFYTNLNLIVAAGDLVLMQNDWTDNYA